MNFIFREIPDWTRVCRKDQHGIKFAFNYDAETYLYLITDRSRAFSGFELQYYLCKDFINMKNYN